MRVVDRADIRACLLVAISGDPKPHAAFHGNSRVRLPYPPSMPPEPDQANRTRALRVAALDNLEVLQADLGNHRFPVHFHSTYVLQWVISGADDCIVSQQTARGGQLFAHGPGVPHAGGGIGGEVLSYVACYPSPKLVSEAVDLDAMSLPPIRTAVLESRAIQKSVDQLFKALFSGSTERAIRRALRPVMLRLFDSAARSEMPPPEVHSPSMSRARCHISMHAARGVSMNELSDVVGLSRFHLLREFKRVHGITPRQFQISERVSRVRQLVSNGASLVDASAMAGFVDQSHMTRAFKAVTAISPGKIRAS